MKEVCFVHLISLITLHNLGEKVTDTDPEPSFVSVRVPLRDGVELAIDYFIASPTASFKSADLYFNSAIAFSPE